MVLSTDLLSYRPARLHRLAGRYESPLPESTLFLVHVLVAVHAGSVYGPSYLLDLFLVHVLLAVHAVPVPRLDYLLEQFLVHVLVAVHASPVPRLPAGPVPGPCACSSLCKSGSKVTC